MGVISGVCIVLFRNLLIGWQLIFFLKYLDTVYIRSWCWVLFLVNFFRKLVYFTISEEYSVIHQNVFHRVFCNNLRYMNVFNGEYLFYLDVVGSRRRL